MSRGAGALRWMLGMLFVGLAVFPLAAIADEDEPTTLERVKATIPDDFCSGGICEHLLGSISPPTYTIPELELLNEGEAGGMTPEQFCAEMENNKPEGCDVNNPPSTPTYDPDWVSNGCGDGSFKVAFIAEVGKLVVPNFNGDLDNPLPGIAFGGACRAHDKCYGSLLARATCDTYFKSMMNNACDGGSPTYASQCGSMANAYYGAVNVGGGGAYAAAQSNRACAAWAKDMEEAGCK
jgi:hypothetical protein